MGELHSARGGTKYYDPPKAVPILGLASDGQQTFLSGGGGGSTASKEVPNQVQVHRYDEATGKVSTVATLNTEKSVVVHLSYAVATGFWLACTQARVKVLELAEDTGAPTELCEWTCESEGRAPELNVARASPAGDTVATGGTDGIVRIWRFARVREAPTLQQACAKQKEVLDLDFSPDSKMVASCDRSGPCRLWDATTGEETFTLKYAKAGKMLAVKAVQFITHAARGAPALVVAGNLGPRDPSYIAIFTTDGTQLCEVKADKQPICAMCVDVRGQWAAATLVAGSKRVYALPDLRRVGSADGLHDLPAPGVAIVGQLAVSGGGDRTINILNFGRGGGGGSGSAFLYMCVILFALLVVAYLTLRIGIKGAALQQGSGGGEL